MKDNKRLFILDIGAYTELVFDNLQDAQAIQKALIGCIEISAINHNGQYAKHFDGEVYTCLSEKRDRYLIHESLDDAKTYCNMKAQKEEEEEEFCEDLH